MQENEISKYEVKNLKSPKLNQNRQIMLIMVMRICNRQEIKKFQKKKETCKQKKKYIFIFTQQLKFSGMY